MKFGLFLILELLVLLVFCFFVFYFGKGHLRSYDHTMSRQYAWAWVLIGIVLIGAVGMRGMHVGLDTEMYESVYQVIIASPSVSQSCNIRFCYVGIHGMVETGYCLLNRFCGWLGWGYAGVKWLVAILSVGPMVYWMALESDHPMMSLFLYFGSTLYYWTFSAMRQDVAMGLVILAYICAMKKKPVPFLILTFLACWFHVSALIILPVYVFNYIPVHKKSIGACLILAFAAVIMKPYLLAILRSMARINYDNSLTGGNRFLLVLISIGVLACVMHEKLRDTDLKNLILPSIFVPVLYYTVNVNPSFYRIVWYYELLDAVLVPNTLELIDRKWIRWAGYACYILLFAYMFMRFCWYGDSQVYSIFS
jgi:hypothetical protein